MKDFAPASGLLVSVDVDTAVLHPDLHPDKTQPLCLPAKASPIHNLSVNNDLSAASAALTARHRGFTV